MTWEKMNTLQVGSKEWFDAAFEHCDATESTKKASMRICHAYGIHGQCDPAYIANVISKKLNPEKQ